MSDTITDSEGAALLQQLSQWQKEGLLEAAIAHWKEAQQIQHLERIATLLVRRGIEIFHAGHIEEALAYFKLALSAQPDNVAALNNAAGCLRDLGCLAESTEHYRRALALQPTFAAAHSGLLMNMQYTSGIAMQDMAAAHKEWAQRHANAPRMDIKAPTMADADRPLRVGFVSSDFGQHPVGYFLVRFLENMDRQNFILSAYADGRRQGYLAERLRSAVAHYHDISGLSDEDLAQKIQADGIDILIDLSGHTSDHRLGVFARKPAPVQIGWLGYPWENGLPTMDYLLGDPQILPHDLQPFLQSRILHLPDCFVCFDPPVEAMPVGPLPALAAGHVTFGFIGNPAKCSDEVIKLWAEILARVPASKLLLKYQGFGEAECRQRFENKFAAHNVAAERLIFESRSPLPELFAVMQTIDLALDPFPFSGGLMSAMTLWMGVPTLTLPGTTFASRQGLSFLTSIGMIDIAATSAEDYIEKAVALAHDLPKLAELRKNLRLQMAASSFCDGGRAAKGLESVLRQAWRDKAANLS